MTNTRERLGVRLTFLVLLLLVRPLSAQVDTYHILLTNDDGIESAGIQALAEHLGTVGQVHLVAPCGERSGSGMSVALRDELHVRPYVQDGDTLGYCVDTTPAGAVLLAITSLSPDGGFDLVVSGINRGANVGTSAHMSGTVGGAMMGALYQLPAVAASLGAGANFDYSAQFVAKFVTELKQRGTPPGIVYSINIPRPTEAQIGGVVVTKMGGSHLGFGYEQTEAGPDGRTFRPRISIETEAPDETDTQAYLSGMITITPLLFDWTAYAAIDELKGWALSHTISR